MAEHPNVAGRRAMQAMNEMDMSRADEEMAVVDASWPTTSSGTRSVERSRAAARTNCGPRCRTMSDTTIKYELHDVVANDDHAIALGTATATRNGKTLNYRTAEIFHINT